jgi:hypothetical protein
MKIIGLLVIAMISFGIPQDDFKREGKGERRTALDKMEGKPAPEWQIEEWISGETTLKDLRGKVVLIDFWGTW